MNILNGISSVSAQSTKYLSEELKRLGHISDIVVYRGQKILKGYEDINLNIELDNYLKYPIYLVKILIFFIKSLIKYDVFHFHFGRSLLPNNIDLWFLKKFKKRIFMEYHGSEIRKKSMFMLKNPTNDKSIILGIDDHKSFKLQKRISKYVDGVIVHDYELKEHLYDLNVNVYLLPLRIDLREFKPYYPKNKSVVKIVHAPSKRDVKGTKFVLDAINKLKLNYQIDFILVEGISNIEAKNIYKTADIIVDQLIVGTYGMLAIESMAYGKPTVCYMRQDLLDFYEEPPPVYSANIYNIYGKLERLVMDYELRYILGKAGRKYVEKYHDAYDLAIKSIAIYQ
ncbi:MAG: hypothetical protein ACVCEJ_07155 [Candidatus Izemoplasmataceae bacterium]